MFILTYGGYINILKTVYFACISVYIVGLYFDILVIGFIPIIPTFCIFLI